MALWSKKPKDTGESGSAISQAPGTSEPQTGTGAMPSALSEAQNTNQAPGAGEASPAQQPTLNPAEAQARAEASRRLMLAFGQIVSVLTRTQPFNTLPLSSIEALIAPAIQTGQFLVAEAQSNANGFVMPVAAVLWASVSPEVDRRLSENLGQPLQLAPAEWRSGPIPWLMLAAGDGRVVNPLIGQLQEKVLQGTPLKMRVKGRTAKRLSERSGPAPDSLAPPLHNGLQAASSGLAFVALCLRDDLLSPRLRQERRGLHSCDSVPLAAASACRSRACLQIRLGPSVSDLRS